MNAEDRVKELEAEVARLRAALSDARVDLFSLIGNYECWGNVACDLAARVIKAIDAALEPTR